MAADKTKNESKTSKTISLHDKARILSEALPFMQRYDGRTVVV